MKMKQPFILLLALIMVLSMTAGALAQDFTETWDENTVLTVFNDLDMYFPDMFAQEDSDFLWVNDNPKDYESSFQTYAKSADVIAKAPLAPETNLEVSFDPCGDGLIKYDLTINKMDEKTPEKKYYYGDSNTSYISKINAYLTIITDEGSSNTYKLGLKTCNSTGDDDCKSVSFKKTKNDADETIYQGHLKGYLTVPAGIIMSNDYNYTVDMGVDFTTYTTALWQHSTDEMGTVYATTTAAGSVKAKKNYCQDSLLLYDAFEYENNQAMRAVYDENTGEARLQVVIRNYQPSDLKKQNYVIPAEVFAFNKVVNNTNVVFGEKTFSTVWTFEENDRITDYTCKYTIYNVANAAPRTEYCKFGEGIAIPNHGMVRIDITVDHLSGDVLRNAHGKLPYTLRLGGYKGGLCGVPTGTESPDDTRTVWTISDEFEPVDFPCPKVSRIQVKNPLVPFMSSSPLLSDGAISPSGAYGTYEDGLWGMYQKCGKMAYMMVRLKNDGLDDEIINLEHTAVAINGGTPMKWNWVMTTVDPEKGNKIVLEAGQEVILIGRAKVTDIPYQLNADIAMIGSVNFSDFGFNITGKVFSDHNNTRCAAAPK